ncbi:PD-(D/E)XK nuclease family protein [Muricauda sp. 2012CJ35-5]|uniref:PD-(D/E)XK nuclease family protein n=1 Tax=Flagellimonas spongiicola TaxID=2942208 RepID=A0ABT0PRY3_9FLAO|nr:PD-(D/E)XK nuclease family protein [Allomuricauda spongiicola]MCL6274143.1 PD-(D/E)XK nuclease family protein [Allomuricauda spongiicola]
MQQAFLEYVLQDLKQKDVAINNCTYVLPSKRSGTFLKKYITNSLEQGVFCPPILAIEEFVLELSELAVVSNLDLLFLLYEAYKQTNIKAHDDFDTFLKWGQTLLQDFNEIDRYLIPQKEILGYLSAIKELNHWSLQQNKTELIQNYLQLWNNLLPIYQAFTENLLSKGLGYQGLIYRTAAQKIAADSKTENDHPIVFIGFNALNSAEIKIIQRFLENPINQVYWDIDSYFLENTIHDAGLFIRDYKKFWSYYEKNSLLGIQNNFLQTKNIEITGVPKSINQAQVVGGLLSQLNESADNGLQNTALVLADESLLNPVLQAIPDYISKVNITMGLPLNTTITYAFFMSYLDMHIAKVERGWFYEDVLSLFSSPLTQVLSTAEAVASVSEITTQIKTHNLIYINSTVLEPYSKNSPLLQLLFPETQLTPKQWVQTSLDLILYLKDSYVKKEEPLLLEHLYRFFKLFNQLQQQLLIVDFISNLKSIKGFFKQLASIETLDFVGEPLSGLQIMGMLESRNLDFETVIITSVNEGILPSGKSNNSFLPFDVKREFGLPTYKEKDAIYTYHFYRLIQRAKNVHLIYNTEPDVLEGGERSRLISQLLTDPNLKDNVRHTIAAPKVEVQPNSPLTIDKDKKMKVDLQVFAANGFSPTSLTNYIRNPIEFYKKSVLKIYDVEEVEESIAANTFGTIIHDSLEVLYKPYIETELTPAINKALVGNAAETIANVFAKILPGVNLEKGRYLLVYNVVLNYILKFLELELAQLQKHTIKIIALEQKFETELQIPELDYPIKLKGTLDRVDLVDGSLRIVDYKTGRVEPINVKLKDWNELTESYDKSKAFQLLCYSYLYYKNTGVSTMIAGIYTFKNLNKGFLQFSFNSPVITDESLSNFEASLFQLISEICNPNIPFIENLE